MDKDFISGLFYGFLGTLGAMLLSSQSLTVILSSSWIGSFLLVWGVITLIFTILEKASDDNEYQEVITIILILITTGYVIVSYSIEIFKIIGAVLLSIALGRALALLFNAIERSLL